MNNKKIRWWWERGYEVSSLPRVPCYTREVTEKDYICDPLVFNCVLRHIERNVFFDELYAFAEWHFGRDHFQITCIDDSVRDYLPQSHVFLPGYFFPRQN
jgi:hypothetical protein